MDHACLRSTASIVIVIIVVVVVVAAGCSEAPRGGKKWRLLGGAFPPILYA